MRSLHLANPQAEYGVPWSTASSSSSASSLTAVIILVCIGLALGSHHEEADTDPEDVPAICSDIIPHELLLLDPVADQQCADEASKVGLSTK